jgi:acetylornithine/succinyldiaminopimelate/putrescine aminotransferase
MNSESVQAELAEPYLAGVLSSAGLDAEYVRAEGNTLYRRGPDEQEIPVIDFAGGYGSLLFGHNNPEIVDCARRLLDDRVPVHAQFSLHSGANELARSLNRIVHRELGTTEPYFAIFANSGAEAVEAAMKCAELDRVLKVKAVADEIAANIEHARSAVHDGLAEVADDAWARFGHAPANTQDDRFDAVTHGIAAHNAGQLARPPVFLALEGGFHGKLVGSVQLSHNEDYRSPFAALAASARFVPRDRPEMLKQTADQERGVLLDVVVHGGVVRVVEREIPMVCAMLVEPIQGEGGIHELSRADAEVIQQVCAAIDCPIVVDEIQAGLGRTGAFLASSQIGLRGDYYVFAKSLGGGIAKTAAMLVREGRYRREFEMLHSSTFAKDGFSTPIALKVLAMLEAEEGKAYRLAEERGAALRRALDAIQADFPDVVKDVRGRGLMLGLEFRDQSAAASPAVREVAATGFLGYVLCGYLLRRHDIRTFPTASAVHTLRFEPSLLLTDGEIHRLDTALRDVCGVLADPAGTVA